MEGDDQDPGRPSQDDDPVDDVEAVMLRNHLAKYYSSDELGACPWQNVIFPQVSDGKCKTLFIYRV